MWILWKARKAVFCIDFVARSFFYKNGFSEREKMIISFLCVKTDFKSLKGYQLGDYT